MVGQNWDDIQDILIAVSKAEEEGFSATKAALQNLLTCTVCPFQAGCPSRECALVGTGGTAATAPTRGVAATEHGFCEAPASFSYSDKPAIDPIACIPQDVGDAGWGNQHVAAV